MSLPIRGDTGAAQVAVGVGGATSVRSSRIWGRSVRRWVQAVASAASCVSPGMRSPLGDVLCQLGFCAQLGSGFGCGEVHLPGACHGVLAHSNKAAGRLRTQIMRGGHPPLVGGISAALQATSPTLAKLQAGKFPAQKNHQLLEAVLSCDLRGTDAPSLSRRLRYGVRGEGGKRGLPNSKACAVSQVQQILCMLLSLVTKRGCISR